MFLHHVFICLSPQLRNYRYPTSRYISYTKLMSKTSKWNWTLQQGTRTNPCMHMQQPSRKRLWAKWMNSTDQQAFIDLVCSSRGRCGCHHVCGSRPLSSFICRVLKTLPVRVHHGHSHAWHLASHNKQTKRVNECNSSRFMWRVNHWLPMACLTWNICFCWPVFNHYEEQLFSLLEIQQTFMSKNLKIVINENSTSFSPHAC